MMRTFTDSSEARYEQVPWGTLAWFSDPGSTGTESLVVVEVRFDPDSGHNFHRHPNQEEVIYVVEGEIEQWVGTEKRTVGAGGSAFISKNEVHASFNTSDRIARILAILGPSIGPDGYELVDVAEEEPWISIR
ncbi:MAG: cupin domain-containing protein [Acidobacteriia bacterium]|nr:cupin domain-containing protein [Terriglobia bacterium]